MADQVSKKATSDQRCCPVRTRHFLLTTLPAIIYGLSALIHDGLIHCKAATSVATGLVLSGSIMAAPGQFLNAQYAWGFATIALWSACAAAIFVALAAIRRQLRADLAIDTLAISLVAIAAFASVFTSSAELNTNCVSREVYEITIGKMQSGTAGVTVLEFVRDIFRVGHVIGISTVILLSVAAAASIVHDTGGSGGNIEGLASQRRGLRRVLFAGAAALLALLFVNSTLFDMPLALVPAKLENAANPLHVDLSSIKAGLMTYWGATQTLILISIYIPAAMILGARAESLALRANPGKPAADRKKWLANNDIDPSWQKQLSDTLAVLSPLLAGILSNVLTGFGKLPTP